MDRETLMKVTFEGEHYSRMINFGIEFWFPKHRDWKKFQASILFGPYVGRINFGSRKRFDEIEKLTSYYKEPNNE
jgi:hypothetical protein